MSQWLRKSTAYTFQLGPFLDDTDGKTAEASLTIARTVCYLSKNGGTMTAKAETTDLTGTGDSLGYYDCVLGTGDTDTVGKLRVHVHVAGALPAWQDFVVVTAAIYDAFIAGTEYPRAHVAPFIVSGTALSAKNVAGSEQFASTLTKTAGSDPVTGAT